MKTFFLLSDLNMGLIISGVFGIATTILTLVVIPLLNKIIAKQHEIHDQVDGMKTELVEATRLLGEAVGNRQGREDVKQEIKEDLEAKPVEVVKPAEVIVIQNKDNEVVIKKNLDK